MAIQKTDAEWDEINFRNNLNPELGGLVKDAVKIAISKDRATKEYIADWLDVLYEIVETKKSLILSTREKPKEKPKEIVNEIYKQDINDINAELNYEAEKTI